MTTFVIGPGGSKLVTVTPEDDGGALGAVGPNAPAWQSSNLSIAVVSGLAPDGLSATVSVPAGAVPGSSTTVSVTGANSLSQIISSSFTVQVPQNPATHYVFSAS